MLNPTPLTAPLADKVSVDNPDVTVKPPATDPPALAAMVVKAPLPRVVLPIGPGAANVAPPSDAALMLELHVMPDADVYPRALDDVLQLGTAMAVGDAVDPVAFPKMVFAAWVASDPGVTIPGAFSVPVIVGLAIVGEIANTGPPEPVAAPDSPVATPVPRPDTPVETGSPVPLVSVTEEGVPRFGVVNVGEVDKTMEPDPVTAFPRELATPAPRPETPVEIGRPLPLVNVIADGVPKLGVTRAGEFERTAAPVPVDVVAPVPPFAAVNGF